MINNIPSVLLIGAGPMAIEYAKVLTYMQINYLVVGRGKKSAEVFQQQTGIYPIRNKIKVALKNYSSIPKYAIVAVSEDQLGKVTIQLIKLGLKFILVEKPGGATFREVKSVHKVAQKHQAKVYIAYNRRFYTSVSKAHEIIKKDEGVLSFNFDFTELSQKIASLNKAQGVKENWFLHNSTHVIDLAFFLGGIPKKMTSFSVGGLPWHSKASIFAGTGITNQKVVFSYHANWQSPSRWGVELLTKQNRLILQPLERLQIQQHQNFDIDWVDINDHLDKKFKPGIYRQVQSFLGNKQYLCTIEEQVNNLKIYYKILAGESLLK